MTFFAAADIFTIIIIAGAIISGIISELKKKNKKAKELKQKQLMKSDSSDSSEDKQHEPEKVDSLEDLFAKVFNAPVAQAQRKTVQPVPVSPKPIVSQQAQVSENRVDQKESSGNEQFEDSVNLKDMNVNLKDVSSKLGDIQSSFSDVGQDLDSLSDVDHRPTLAKSIPGTSIHPVAQAIILSEILSPPISRRSSSRLGFRSSEIPYADAKHDNIVEAG